MGNANKICGRTVGVGIAAVLSGTVAGQALPNAPFKTYIGSEANARMGSAVLMVGDVNGDGVTDYIAGSPGSSLSESGAGAAFLRSGANGAILQSYSDIGSDSFGWSITRAGDFDNDGVEDIIIGDPERFVGCMERGAIHLFSGAGGFQLMAIVGETLNEQYGWALGNAGDVNGDGVSDVIVGSPQFSAAHNGRAVVLSGVDCNILFEHIGLSGARFGSSVAGLGDVNGDGFADIAVGAPGIGKTYILDAHNQQVIRTLNGSSAGQSGWSITAVDDLTGDGVTELAVAAPFQSSSVAAGRATIYNPVNGQSLRTVVGSQVGSGFGYRVACAGDVNGDGYNDLIVAAPWEFNANGSAGSVRAIDPLTGQVIRQFTGGSSLSMFGSSLCAAGDVNGDGFADVMVGAAEAGPLHAGAAYLYLGGDNGFGLADPVQSGTSVDKPAAVAIADLDDDGFDDVATVSPATNRVDVLYSNGDGSFEPPVRYVANGKPTSIAAADLDGDGRVDLAVTLSALNKVLLLRQSASGAFTAAGTRKVGKNPSAIVAADLNNDGMPDLAVANRNSKTVNVFMNSSMAGVPMGSRLKTSKKYAVKAAPTQIVVGDVNSDFKMDLIVVNSGSGNISTLLGGSSGVFAAQKLTTTGSNPLGVAVADFNGDWFDDMAYINKSSNAVSIRYGSFAGTFSPAQVVQLSSTPVAIATTDMDHDGLPDLVTVNADATAAMLINNGSTGFDSPVTSLAASGAAAMALGDIDGDADIDVVSASTAIKKVAALINQWF